MKKHLLNLICILVFSQSTYFTAQAHLMADTIAITKRAEDVADMMKVGDGQTYQTQFLLPSYSKLYKKGIEDLKKKALAVGANVIFIKTNEVDQSRGYAVHLVAEFYKDGGAGNNSQQLLPGQTGGLTKPIGNGMTLTITDCVGNLAEQTVRLDFTFTNPTAINQRITVYGGPRSGTIIRTWVEKSVAFDENGTQYPCKNDFWLMTEKQLPTGLRLKGSITFSNVLPNVAMLALAKISVQRENWDGGGDSKLLVVEFRDLKINWAAANKAPNRAEAKNSGADTIATTIKNIDNRIDLSVSGCRGDIQAQTASVYITFSNPVKVNQTIKLYLNELIAFDEDGNQYKAQNAHFVTNKAESGYYSSNIETPLPTNLKASAVITFTNILPSLKKLALVNIPVNSSNLDGGDDSQSGVIEVRNLRINWQIPKPYAVKKAAKKAGKN